jgi:nitrogen fixation protein FixH
MAQDTVGRELKGRHVLAIFLGAFATIIAVNLFMAFKALGTFPGTVAKSSFQVSQSFDADRAAQVALGWQVETRLEDGARLSVRFPAVGGPVDLTGLFGRTAGRAEDVTLAFAEVSPGLWTAPVATHPGQWVLFLNAVAPDGTPWRQRVEVPVR